MTIEISGSGSPKEITPGNLFQGVDGATNDPILLKSLTNTKGFLAFEGMTKSEYIGNEEKGENNDEDGVLYRSGEGLQLIDGVIAMGS